MSFSLKARGYEVVCRTATFDELLAFERENKKDDFAAMRSLFRKCKESGDATDMPAALEVSFAKVVLEQSGSGADVRKVDEFDLPQDVADAMVKFADRGELHVLETCGIHLLIREPRNAEMEAFWKGRDKSQLSAARDLLKQVTLYATGSPADAPTKGVLEQHPGVVSGLAAAVSEIGGFTLEVEVGKA